MVEQPPFPSVTNLDAFYDKGSTFRPKIFLTLWGFPIVFQCLYFVTNPYVGHGVSHQVQCASLGLDSELAPQPLREIASQKIRVHP